MKVLPEDFLEGEESKARFEREAQLLASAEPSRNRRPLLIRRNPRFFVLLLLLPPSLRRGTSSSWSSSRARRSWRALRRGRMALEQLLPIGMQIADALDQRAPRRGSSTATSSPATSCSTKQRREAARLRPREGPAAPGAHGVRRHVAADDGPAAARSRSRGRSSGRSSTWRPSSSRAARRTRGATSSRSAPSLYEMATGKKAFDGQEPGEPDRLDPEGRPGARPRRSRR